MKDRDAADAARYRHIKKYCSINLGSYCSDTGWLPGATESWWCIETASFLRGKNKRLHVRQLDKLIDRSIERVKRGGER